MATPHGEPLGIREYSHSRARALLCPFSSHHMLPEHQGRDSFWKFAPCNLFPGHLREQSFSSCQQEEKGAAANPMGKLCGAPESPGWRGQRKHSLHCRWRGVGLPCFFYGIRDSIEILVHTSFCLLPGHMVLSLVSYFYFIFFKFLFLGDKIGHLKKVLF